MSDRRPCHGCEESGCLWCHHFRHTPAIRRALGGDPATCDPPPLPSPVPTPAGAGLVVGCYGLPQLARLQVRTIRSTCGPVPILLADDGSGHDADFAAIEDGEPDVTFWPSDRRRGHYAGDLSVWWKGIQWAHTRGLRWLAKLSQRFVWTAPGWLAAAIKTLEASNLSLLMQRCVDSGTDLFVRTECTLFDVPRWVPHFREFDRDRIGNPTELYVWDLVVRHFGGRYAEWPGLTTDRYAPTPGTHWHGSHAEGPFRRLAERYGIDLGSDFHCGGHQHRPGWKQG